MGKKDNEETEKTESKVWSEIKAFFTLVFIIGLISVGVWYWYTHFYSPNKNVNKENKETEVAKDYNLYTYEATSGRTLKVINDKYIYEIDEDKFDLFKVMDLSGNVLFEGKEKYSEFFVGIDGEFYFIKDELADFENVVSLYKLENKAAVLVKKFSQERVYFSPIFYRDNEKEILLGFAGSKIDYSDSDYVLDSTYFYDLKGEEKKTNEFIINSDEVINAVEVPYYSNSDKYIKISDKTGKKYGVLNIENFEVIIEPTYDDLYTNYDGKTFVAIKDGKAGIIDEKQKKLVDFEYDYIDRNDGFYVVGKDNKMAIMDGNYRLVTDFEFDYQTGGLTDMDYSYALCCSNFNTFEAYKVGDRYVLVTNVNQLSRNINYKKSITYVIKEDGTYDSITADEFVVTDDLIYSYNDKKNEYVVYDKSLNPKFSLDASKYDFSYVADLVRFGNTVVYDEKNVYYDYENGEELDEPKDYEYSFDNVKVQYSNGKVNVLVDDKNVHSYDYKPFDDVEFINEIDNGFYYITEKEVVVLKK